MQGLCDTGATRSVISADLAKRLKLKVTKSQLINPFLPANGQPMCPLGQVSINVNIQGLIIPTILYVVNNLHPKLILGNDWLKSTRAVIDYRTGILSLYDDLLLCPLEGFNSRHNCVTLRQTVCLQPYSESILPVQVPQKYSSSSVLIEPLLCKDCRNALYYKRTLRNRQSAQFIGRANHGTTFYKVRHNFYDKLY